MNLAEKYSKINVMLRYPLGEISIGKSRESEEIHMIKIFQPPSTIPEELSHDLLHTLEEETRALQERDPKVIVPPFHSNRIDKGLIAIFNHPSFPSLYQYIHKDNPLKPKTIISLLEQLADIFSHLFDLGIHRFQLEPDLILINPKNHRIVYLDTGLVNLAKYPEIIRLGYLDGKPQFLPPELLRAGELSAASEVYILSVLTHYLFTGKLPFENLSPAAVAAYSIYEHLPPLNRYKNAREPKLNKLISEASEKKPEKRIASVEEFLKKLKGTFSSSKKTR